MKYLTDNGAIINSRSNCPLRWAVKNNHINIVQFLIKNGADVHANCNECIQTACENRNFDIIKCLVEHGANVHINYNSPIKIATRAGSLKIVKYLVEHGVCVHDNTVLIACRTRQFEIVKYLVQQGASRIGLHKNTVKYLSFCEKMDPLKKYRASKKIYFWWIQVCYNPNILTGQRSMYKNYNEYVTLCGTK